jgi:mitochondrial fission protein ELM1
MYKGFLLKKNHSVFYMWINRIEKYIKYLMLKLRALLLTQGMHGMISQVEGLANALGLSFRHETIKLKKFWNYFPPSLTPKSNFVLEKKFVCDSRVIISCGRKSVVPSILLKKQFKKEVFNIHIQDPKIDSSNFDCIICPQHDELKGENILNTQGSIHYLTNDEIKKNLNYLNPRAKDKKIVAFILGGPNKYYSFSEKQMDNMFRKIKNLFISSKYKLIIIPSYRTPENILKLAFNYFNDDHMVIKERDKKAYLSSLGLADTIIVTCDSTSMISEAAITGKPIYISHMNNKRNIHRFTKFFNLFKELGIVRDLEDKVEHWTYNGLDEVNRVALLVKAKMEKNGII